MRTMRNGNDVQRGAGEWAMTAGEKLQRVRKQALLVRRLGEQLRAISQDGVRSPHLTGMPLTHGPVCGIDVLVERREALERMLREEAARLRAYEKEARAVMDNMRPDHYAFAALYYIGGLSLEETGEALERSERQCRRYKREVEGRM